MKIFKYLLFKLFIRKVKLTFHPVYLQTTRFTKLKAYLVTQRRKKNHVTTKHINILIIYFLFFN